MENSLFTPNNKQENNFLRRKLFFEESVFSCNKKLCYKLQCLLFFYCSSDYLNFCFLSDCDSFFVEINSIMEKQTNDLTGFYTALK